MKRPVLPMLLAVVYAALALQHLSAQSSETRYPRMAPVAQYMMERGAEIELARSAAPGSIAQDAEIRVLGQRGYEIAAKGGNGFVCMVQRSWTTGPDDPEFWNPKLRAPICFNPPATRSYLPVVLRKTQLILARGHSKTQMFDAINAEFQKNELPPLEPGAMCYMMSKQGHLNDHDGHWRPHLMIFLKPSDAAMWGAGLPGSPILRFTEVPDRISVLMIPVDKWSDGTVATPME
jgi:hypothetical protein